MIRAVLVGATGRMGRAIIQCAQELPGIAISGAVASATSSALGRDAGELAGARHLGVPVTDDVQALLAAADVVIDFSTALASAAHLAACRAAGKPLLLCTTGRGTQDREALALAARDIALLVAPNASLAVTLLLELARTAAAALPPDFDIEIIDSHHRHKADAPSGTALALGQAVAEARSQDFETVAVINAGRDHARRAGAIGFAVVRGGDQVGEHTVLFLGPGEELTLTHRAGERAIFARGALKAAAWLASQPPGLYSMRDIFPPKTVS